MYTHARELSGEVLESKAILSAQNATAEDSQAARLYVDTLKWAAAKRFPKQYSDRVQQDINANVTVTAALADRVNAARKRAPGSD